MLIPKIKPIRDEKYRRYLHEQPCRACGGGPCQAAHLGHARGMGYKEGDDWCVSLCERCHLLMDTHPKGKEYFWMTKVAIPEAKRAYREWKATRD